VPLISHEVNPCSRCGKRHRFAIELSQGEQEAILFGGPGDGDQVLEVGFVCSDTGELFTDRITIPSGTRFERVVKAGGAAERPSPADAAEFADWVKGSRALATDFCRTMLTTASGAIPVYFAVLNYLGTARVEGSLGSKVSALPPLLFLAAIVLFALALRPQLTSLTPDQFAAYRGNRLRRLNRFIGWGIGAFSAGMALALGVFLRALDTI
jgi:hypothetical protein